MSLPEIRKQISIFLPLSEWQAIRMEAARNKMPVTELCREWMRPNIAKLMRKQRSNDDNA